MLSDYVYKNKKKLRRGYTTGSCAAAAAKAAARMLLTGREVREISIQTPKNIVLSLSVEDISMDTEQVSCAVRKDAGDDADCTDGMLIYACVSFGTDSGTDAGGNSGMDSSKDSEGDAGKNSGMDSSKDSDGNSGIDSSKDSEGDAGKNSGMDFNKDSGGCPIFIEGGKGIGRVTKPGLEQPVGSAAINRVPREMIQHEVSEELIRAGYEGAIRVLISAPGGEKIAEKTLNPRLGIEGGISILGTSGIVEPMSEQAMIETIRLEMRQKKRSGETILLLSPGNYGQQFAREHWQIDLDQSVKCSNFIGETLDGALELGFEKILLIGHIGKLVKIASGVMNTHSNMADARLETLCACALLAGCDADTARSVLCCTTTDDALRLLQGTDYFSGAMNIMLDKILYHMNRRTGGNIQIEVIVFSNLFGVLAQSGGAEKLAAERKTLF